MDYRAAVKKSISVHQELVENLVKDAGGVITPEIAQVMMLSDIAINLEVLAAQNKIRLDREVKGEEQ